MLKATTGQRKEMQWLSGKQGRKSAFKDKEKYHVENAAYIKILFLLAVKSFHDLIWGSLQKKNLPTFAQPYFTS